MAKTFLHKNAAAGEWFTLSLFEQLGNIGSEVGRVCRWQEKDPQIFQRAVERALELFDLTLEDPRWSGRRREIARVREIFCDAVCGGMEYGCSLQNLEEYFYPFALAAQRMRP